jgi:hypothetical protein
MEKKYGYGELVFGLLNASKNPLEVFNLVTDLVFIERLYSIGMTYKGAPNFNSYKIATSTLFVTTTAPYWIAYSALLRIALVNKTYERQSTA